jgi:hypothetical protein
MGGFLGWGFPTHSLLGLYVKCSHLYDEDHWPPIKTNYPLVVPLLLNTGMRYDVRKTSERSKIHEY